MTYPPPMYPYPPQPPPPPSRTWDTVLSAILLVLAGAVVGLGGFLGLFTLAFLDDCRPEKGCSATGAWTAVGSGVLVAAAVGIVGLIVTVVRIRRRRAAWPFALFTLLLAALALVAGGFGFVSAVG